MSGVPIKIDIGITTAYDFFFEVRVPNYKDFRKQPPTTILNAAWSLWHIHEWYYWQNESNPSKRGLENFRDKVLKECPELAGLRDITDAGKHSWLYRSSVKVQAMTTRTIGGPLGGGPIGAAPLGGFGEEFFIDVGGKRHDLGAIMDIAFNYWLGKVLPHHEKLDPAMERERELYGKVAEWCKQHVGTDHRIRRWKWSIIINNKKPNSTTTLAFLKEEDKLAFKSWWDASVATS